MIDPRRRRRTAPRGAALLLVLIALAVGLLLVATWLDGRRESVPVAQRVSAGAVARHAAATGLDLACATIDADDDWRDTVATGGFAGSFRIDEVDVTYDLTDADDGDSPDDDTVRLRIRCEAWSDEIPGIIEGVLDVSPEETVIDVDFGETAIIARDRVAVRDRATVLPWTGRPGDDAGVLVLGTLDGDPEAVSIEHDALVAQSEILSVDTSTAPHAASARGRRVLPDRLPALPTPEPGIQVDPDRPPLRTEVRLRRVPETRIDAGDVTIPGNARWTVDGDLQIRADRRIQIQRGACVVVQRGTLSLEAAQRLNLREATILVRPGARLELRGGERVLLDGATIGQTAAATLAIADTGMLPLESDPQAVVVVADDRGAVAIRGDALLAATIVAPEASVTLEDGAILHGRVVAAEATLRDDAVLFARPDDGRVIGLTSPVGPHRDETGRLTPEVAELDRTDESFLMYLAETLELPVCGDGRMVRPLLVATARAAEQARTMMLRSRRAAATAARWSWIDPHGGDR